MEKLIELLNEYEVEKKPSRLQRNYYLGFVHNFGKGIMYIDEEGEDVDDYRTDYEIISKEYGFIKWLVDNDKIDRDKCGLTNEGFLNWYDKGIAFVKNYDNDTYKVTEFYLPYFQLLMILSIQNEPLTFLISILK